MTRQALPNPLPDLIWARASFQRFGAVRFGVRDEHGNDFAVMRVREADDGGFGDVGVGEQSVFDFQGVDVLGWRLVTGHVMINYSENGILYLPAADDQVLDAPCDFNVSFVVHLCLVARLRGLKVSVYFQHAIG